MVVRDFEKYIVDPRTGMLFSAFGVSAKSNWMLGEENDVGLTEDLI